MAKYVGVLIVGLIVGGYLGASFSDSVAAGLERLHVSLLGHHTSMTSR